MKPYKIAYFAASVDDAETNKKFAESLDLNYAILSDPAKSVAESYGVLNDSGKYAQRWTFYIDKDGKIAKIDREVKPATSGADMVGNVIELGFGM